VTEVIKGFEQACNEGLSKEELEKLFEKLEEDKAHRVEAREFCLMELAENPKNGRCRLFLANLYYLDNYPEFCVRELVELKKYSTLESVDRLIESFGNFGQSFIRPVAVVSEGEAEAMDEEGDDIMAELDFDSEFIDVLDELEEEDL